MGTFHTNEHLRMLFGKDSHIQQTMLIAGATVFISYTVLHFIIIGTEVYAGPISNYNLLVGIFSIIGYFLLVKSVKTEFNPLVKGFAIGTSSFVAFISLLYVILSVRGVGDDFVLIAITGIFLFVSSLHSYYNRGLVICWYVIAAPVTAFFIPYYLAGGGIQEHSLSSAIVSALIIAVPVSVILGTIGFILGTWIDKYDEREIMVE